MDIIDQAHNKHLHRYSILVVAATCVLIYAGGLVTTIGAGLAVPDWPLSFNSLNPAGWWKAPDASIGGARSPGVREEHSHRLLGATVGFLTLLLAAFLWRYEKRQWLRRLGIAALALVIIQGILGGLRVIDKNIYFAMVHACLAQLFLCVLITVMWATSAGWLAQDNKPTYRDSNFKLSAALWLAIFVQLIIGAIMRHSGAGMAIPTFPSVFGGVVPNEWTFPITIHYLHRVWAVVILIMVAVLYIKSFADFKLRARIAASGIAVLTFVQLLLGAAVIVTGRSTVITTAHVLTGAVLLGTAFTCAMWCAKDGSVESIATA